MTKTGRQEVKAIDLGRELFEQVVRPALARICPETLAKMTCGRFGWGSECLGLDDAVSRDHHWGPSVDILIPEEVLTRLDPGIWTQLGTSMPREFRGFPLESGPVGAGGLTVESLESFLMRTIGRTTPPVSLTDWLDMPEEDIIHAINGEVWHDPIGDFTRIRSALAAYYPEPVWLRRLAHWCRYCSGMGLYALNRALLRENWPYAYWTFSRTLKLTMEITFLLNRTYFPYDKWLYPCFRKLPHLAKELDPWIQEATSNKADWPRKVHLLEQMHDRIDRHMVESGIVPPHPVFQRSETSGYRVLEYNYREILTKVPPEILNHTPLWDQKFFEGFVSGLVVNYSQEAWISMLNLKPAGEKHSG